MKKSHKHLIAMIIYGRGQRFKTLQDSIKRIRQLILLQHRLEDGFLAYSRGTSHG